MCEIADEVMWTEPDPEPAYREGFVCWATDPGSDDFPFDDNHPHNKPCDWGWVCSHCTNRVDDQPCPEHAPKDVPGLRLVECEAGEQRHYLFAHDRDDYGHGCPWCWHERVSAELKPLKEAAERRAHRWCWLLNRCKRMAARLRLVRIYSYGGSSACWHVSVKRRWFA